MSLENILKILVDSRQQTGSPQASDPMTQLIGGLLGGSDRSQAPGFGQPAPGNQSAGLSDMMGLLEGLMGNQPGQSTSPMGSPIMALLEPFVDQLAGKLKIQPEIAMIIISFVVHKLLAHHPTSNRDSNSFDLDSLLNQMGTGQIDPGVLESSGMIRELSSRTGLDEQSAARGLSTALRMFGNQIQSMDQPARRTPGAGSRGRSAGKSLKSASTKKGSRNKLTK